ncbi:PepSY-associated TM helix domain-containing protein [uncultured Flavobacterium sp.]|uniref:PepSY-associated TM helix domain-containing protein n=1 Tax=uncultured Flavobacterium sp. TaxID=165435 RepID=UPI0030CA1C4C|tara:strand:- start:463 stop:1008 length:546 start_codon:yes stop_codon:yes gene_type:complete
MKKVNTRELHRDLGYFYLGLIITFAISGIFMNHRDRFDAAKFTIETSNVKISVVIDKEITEETAKAIGASLGIKDQFRRHKIKKNILSLSYEKNDVEIDLATGIGQITTFVKTPVISQMMKLHKNTSNWWIYFSDVFGISLIFIALTGAMMIKHGKYTFKQRGWKLALAGILFPILFLIFG